MTEVVSVKFKSKGKVYYFDPVGKTIEKGQHVIVETLKSLEYAECVWGNHEVEDSAVIPPLRPVIRIATEEDDKRAADNKSKEAEAFEICRQKILAHQLDMKLVDVEYSFDGSKILFCFTSDGRVDFRELVKDLAATFKMRIELRQIGVRDEARMLGGLGICGRPFCCAQFLDDFQPVSIKMAKTQGLSLNPTKISGTCGRLMCCLKYEQDAYEDLVKKVPKVDAFVDTPEGKGMVSDVNLLRGKVRVKLENHAELTIHTFDSSEVTVLGGKAQRAEYLAALAEGKIVEEPKKPKAAVPATPEQQEEEFLPELHFKNGFSSLSEKVPAPSEPVQSANVSDDSTERRRKRNSSKSDQQQGSAESTGKEPQKERKDNRSRRRRRSSPKKQDKDNQQQNTSGQTNQKKPKETSKPAAEQSEAQSPRQKSEGEQAKKPRRRPYYRRRNNGKKPQNKQNND